jgi:hypothetical protein
VGPNFLRSVESCQALCGSKTFLPPVIGQDERLGKSTHKWKIEGLGATEPYPNLKEKLALFGQFVGDWDIVEARYPQPVRARRFDSTTQRSMLGTVSGYPQSKASYRPS